MRERRLPEDRPHRASRVSGRSHFSAKNILLGDSKSRWVIANGCITEFPGLPDIFPNWTISDQEVQFDLGEYRLDPANDNLDISRAQKLAQKGIYTLDGDSLRLCIGYDGKARPTSFATTRGSGFALYVLRRLKE